MLAQSLFAAVGFAIGSAIYWFRQCRSARKVVEHQEGVIADLRRLRAEAVESEKKAWTAAQAAAKSEQAAWTSAREIETEVFIKQDRLESLLDSLRQIRSLADGVKHFDPAEKS